MENKELKSFLGTGWSFPPTFRRNSRTVAMVSEAEDIRQSLYILFSTTPGERILNPRYGCGLQSLVFERHNASTENRIVDLISMAVLYFEPRIILDEVEVRMIDRYSGHIEISVYYTIRLTNTRENIVYPFYFQEGTNIVNQ